MFPFLKQWHHEDGSGAPCFRAVPAQLPAVMPWLLLRGGRRFPCPQRMELGETSHGCPVEEIKFLPDLKILNNPHSSRSWGLFQPLDITRVMLPGLAKVPIALKCPAIKSQSPLACLGRSRVLGTARSPKQSTAAAQRKKEEYIIFSCKVSFFLPFCRDGLKTARTTYCIELPI